MKKKIGLALSGGGFRASLFHLGVIRRLEELGIMKDVAIVSSVSGGSIIAAYYLVEMEKRLRRIPPVNLTNDTRIEIFESIATDFIRALDHNVRSRAINFAPFYHPWLFVKTLFNKTFRGRARSELIQGEYDRWFYDYDTLDQLPSVNRTLADDKPDSPLVGPKLVINTTSLLTGERVAFSREPNTGVDDLKTPDRNQLPLSQVVAASAGVPVAFPPTWVRGNLLVDGGVADNQGIEGLRAQHCERDCKYDHVHNFLCDVFIVSDASGQMEARDSMGAGSLGVYKRVSSIFQFQIRNKLLDSLVAQRQSGTEISFIHLYYNLKDLEARQPEHTLIPRVSSSLIPAIARIRTDLDQFSPTEREALMYHGYTLIDADLKAHCSGLLEAYGNGMAPMRIAGLFARTLGEAKTDLIRCDLEAGCEGVFLLRSLKKYRWKIGRTYVCGLLAWLLLSSWLFSFGWLLPLASNWISKTLHAAVPGFFKYAANLLPYGVGDNLRQLLLSVSALSGFLAVLAVPLYIVMFFVFVRVRRQTRRLDLQVYRKIADSLPNLHWKTPAE